MTVTRILQLGLGAVVLVAALTATGYLRPYMIGIITAAMIFALFAMSINLLAGWVGLVSLGHAGIMATAAYGVAYVAVRDGSVMAQLAAGLGAGLAVSLLFGLMAMRTGKVYFLMITLAQGMVVWGIAYRLGSVTGGENGLVGIYRPAPVAPYWVYYYLVLGVLLLGLALMWLITRSSLGLTLQGLRDSETRMVSLGYNPALYKLYAFVLSGLFASVAGILYVYFHEFISPATADFIRSGNGVLMVILGGVGTLSGPLVGSFVVLYVENVVSSQTERWPSVLGLIFILAILFARDGIVGGASRLWRRTRWGAADSPHDPPAPSHLLDPSAGDATRADLIPEGEHR